VWCGEVERPRRRCGVPWRSWRSIEPTERPVVRVGRVLGEKNPVRQLLFECSGGLVVEGVLFFGPWSDVPRILERRQPGPHKPSLIGDVDERSVVPVVIVKRVAPIY